MGSYPQKDACLRSEHAAALVRLGAEHATAMVTKPVLVDGFAFILQHRCNALPRPSALRGGSNQASTLGHISGGGGKSVTFDAELRGKLTAHLDDFVVQFRSSVPPM
jgi:hypothetical protein